MKTVRNPFGGGAKTNLNGLGFEIEIDISKAITAIEDYEVLDNLVLKSGKKVGEIYSKHELYKKFLEPRKIIWKNLISKRLLPDRVLINFTNKTAYVIEIKYQAVAGSVDEKLQTCDFKRKQYLKLFAGTGFSVEYVYLLNSFFANPKYSDVFEYIESVDCRYFLEEIPLVYLGL